MLFKRPVGIDRQDLGLQVGQLSQELLPDCGCVRVKGFNPGRDIFLSRGAAEEARTFQVADVLGPALIPPGSLAFGPGNEEFLLLARKAGHNRGEYAGNAGQVVCVRVAHGYDTLFSSRRACLLEGRKPFHESGREWSCLCRYYCVIEFGPVLGSRDDRTHTG